MTEGRGSSNAAWAGLVGALLVALVGSTSYLSFTRVAGTEVERLRQEAFALGQAAPQGTAGPPAAKNCPKRLVVGGIFRPVEFTTDFYGLRYVGDSTSLLDQHILYFGAFEKPVLHFLRDTMKKLDPDAGVFVDVGANTGQHSLFMSKFSRQVHAVEPYDRVLKRFRHMIEINGIANIVVHPVGLGAEPGEVMFYEPPEKNLAIGSFVEAFSGDNKRSTKLQIVRGDELFANEKVDLLKIDIEGYEKLAVAGLKKTLEKSRPVVVMEITIREDLAEGFQSAEELQGAFPEGYEFYQFNRAKYHRRQGRYVIDPFDMDFSRNRQAILVIFPKDKKQQVVFRSASRDDAPEKLPPSELE